MLSPIIWNIFFVCLLSALCHSETSDALHHTLHKRSLEGQTCDPNNATSCQLAYTACDATSRTCRCDRGISVGMQVSKFPEVIECIPLDYVRLTGRCLPTNPDMCAIVHPGSFCDASKRSASAENNTMTCECQHGGIFPNCTIRIGSICTSNETCAKDVKNSMCTNVGEGGIGSCSCGGPDNRTYVPNEDGSVCHPTNCAARPCRGDDGASECRDTANGYECVCREKSKGRRHTFDNNGICCTAARVPCDDFSRCIAIEAICNGVADCADCSDELKSFCPGTPPSSNATCGALFSTPEPSNTTPAWIDSTPSVESVANVVDPSVNRELTEVAPKVPRPQVETAVQNVIHSPHRGPMNFLSSNFNPFAVPFEAAMNPVWRPTGR